MTNIYWNIKQNNKKSSSRARTFLLQSWIYNIREFLQIPQQKSEAATGCLLGKNLYSEILQNSQEKTVPEPLFS